MLTSFKDFSSAFLGSFLGSADPPARKKVIQGVGTFLQTL